MRWGRILESNHIETPLSVRRAHKSVQLYAVDQQDIFGRKHVERFGCVDPLIVNAAPERKNIVIVGHFRLSVAKKLGIDRVPVVYATIPDLEREKKITCDH